MRVTGIFRYYWRALALGGRRRLISECEAFAAGRYMKSYVHRYGWAEPWVWLNTLAHGDRASIQALAQASGKADDGTAPARYLARELLGTADNSGLSLESVQRFALVPLELRCRATRSLFSSREITKLALAELRRVAIGASSAESRAFPRAQGNGSEHP